MAKDYKLHIQSNLLSKRGGPNTINLKDLIEDIAPASTSYEYTTPQTDTVLAVPSWAKEITVVLVGGGGGGCSGRTVAAAGTTAGGGGASSGYYVTNTIPVSFLQNPTTILITVGVGGTGGAATTGTSYNVGTNGTATTVKIGSTVISQANNGLGATSSGGAAASGVGVMYSNRAGASGGNGNGSDPSTTATLTVNSPQPGAGGGGVSSGAFGLGGSTNIGGSSWGALIIGGLGGQTEGASGASAPAVLLGHYVGAGGAGGAGSNIGNGGNGGNGIRGGGGGGGGSCAQPATSGAGGNGGNGYALITFKP